MPSRKLVRVNDKPPIDPVVEGPQVFAGRRVLLLQGPFGPFFRRFAKDLRRTGAIVSKINFNAGDEFYYPFGATRFRGTQDQWPGFLQQVLITRNIDTIVLFGDCRPIHRAAMEVARACGVQTLVFEEGYVRPDYVTLETQGANGHSTMPRDPDYYRPFAQLGPDMPVSVGPSIVPAVVWGFFYYLVANLFYGLYPHYRHHRGFTLLEALPWWLSFFRKPYYALRERGMLDRLTPEGAPPFFLVPLQVFNDSQIHVHSRERGMHEFIRRVTKSFAENAPAEARLVLKHHPMDRGYITYSRLVRQLEREFGLEGRLFYIHDQHLPSLLRRARGLVTINSTVGMSALLHDVPVITLGTAYYDIEGLTYRGQLDRFWAEAEHIEVDQELFRGFRYGVVARTQLNGNFYKRTPGSPTSSGLNWLTADSQPLAKNVIAFPGRQGDQPGSPDNRTDTLR